MKYAFYRSIKCLHSASETLGLAIQFNGIFDRWEKIVCIYFCFTLLFADKLEHNSGSALFWTFDETDMTQNIYSASYAILKTSTISAPKKIQKLHSTQHLHSKNNTQAFRVFRQGETHVNKHKFKNYHQQMQNSCSGKLHLI